VENPQGISAKAMAVILDETLSGAPPEQVAEVSPEIVYQVFGRELSMGKSMGLMSMVGMVSALAKRHAEARRS
jgi:cysteine desulfuration protein SufE